MSLRETLLKSADNLELMARASEAQASDPDNSHWWRERDAKTAKHLFETAALYRRWAANRLEDETAEYRSRRTP